MGFWQLTVPGYQGGMCGEWSWHPEDVCTFNCVVAVRLLVWHLVSSQYLTCQAPGVKGSGSSVVVQPQGGWSCAKLEAKHELIKNTGEKENKKGTIQLDAVLG
eukprot:scaffold78156_cov20-Tisochrysis_lutea.AAC.1